MLTNIALLSLALISAPAPTAGRGHPGFYRPRIEIWTNKDDGAVYTRGDRVQLYFRLDQDAYVTIFRIDTDGRVRVLFPREPWEDNFARGGRDFEVDGDQLNREAFAIDDYPGVGYLFAVAAPDPFVYDQIETADHWDYRVIADGRVRGDPYVALTDLAQRIVPEGYADWDYDVMSYNVESHHDYPRFLCYDCHSYVSYSYWDPYYTSCVRFRMYVYEDPWYYPYRTYGGGRVVFVRPYRPQPRFIFKDWGSTQPNRDGFVTRERERPVNDNTRRGVTGRDLSGLGIIPPPDVRDRRDGRGTVVRTGGTDDRTSGGWDRGGVERGRDRQNTQDRPATQERPMVLPPRERSQQQQAREQQSREQQPRDQQPQVQPRVRETEPRRVEPRRVEPQRVEPRNEPRNQPRAEPRSEPRNQPRAQPRNEPRNQPRAEPRNEPRSQPRAQPAREKPRNEPEVRRRKP